LLEGLVDHLPDERKEHVLLLNDRRGGYQRRGALLGGSPKDEEVLAVGQGGHPEFL